jgi:ketosteroid isomerase-like protein
MGKAAPFGAAHFWIARTPVSQQNVETIRALYAAFAKGDVPTVLGALAPDAEWREADNFIYADGNPYVGTGAILQGKVTRFQQYADTLQVARAATA